VELLPNYYYEATIIFILLYMDYEEELEEKEAVHRSPPGSWSAPPPKV